MYVSSSVGVYTVVMYILCQITHYVYLLYMYPPPPPPSPSLDTQQQPTVASLLQLQHRSSMFLRNIPIPDQPTPPTKDSPPVSTTDSYCSYGRLGQVECTLESFESLERVGEE